MVFHSPHPSQRPDHLLKEAPQALQEKVREGFLAIPLHAVADAGGKEGYVWAVVFSLEEHGPGLFKSPDRCASFYELGGGFFSELTHSAALAGISMTLLPMVEGSNW